MLALNLRPCSCPGTRLAPPPLLWDEVCSTRDSVTSLMDNMTLLLFCSTSWYFTCTLQYSLGVQIQVLQGLASSSRNCGIYYIQPLKTPNSTLETKGGKGRQARTSGNGNCQQCLEKELRTPRVLFKRPFRPAEDAVLLSGERNHSRRLFAGQASAPGAWRGHGLADAVKDLVVIRHPRMRENPEAVKKQGGTLRTRCTLTGLVQ